MVLCLSYTQDNRAALLQANDEEVMTPLQSRALGRAKVPRARLFAFPLFHFSSLKMTPQDHNLFDASMTS